MATRNSWEGFKPDTSPVPEEVKKSPHEQLDDIAEQLDKLEEKRRELLFEIEKDEVRQKVLEDQDFYEEVHKDCPHRGEIDDQIAEAREEAETLEDEAWEFLRKFGGHTAACLSGALAGSQALHRLCTCGWNHVATQLERR